MRILTFLATLAIAVALAPTASAAELKIGYVDLQQALNEVDEGKAAKAQLKKDFDDKQKRLDREQSELKRMKEDLDKQAVVMADDARREKQGELDRKFMEVQGLFVQLQKELSEREREVTRGIFEKMTQIIREIAEADGFTLVFERTDAGLVYAPKSLDLTSDLIRKYNARYKGAGASGASGAGASGAGAAGAGAADAGKKKAEPAKK